MLLVAIEPFVVLEDARVLQLPRLPHLVLGKLFLLPEMLLGRLVVRKLELDAGDLSDLRIQLPLTLAHRVGYVVVVAVQVALLGARLQVLASLLVHLPDGEVELGPGDADDLDEDFLVPLDPVRGAGHHAGLPRQLAQVAEALLAALCRLHRDEAAVVHDPRDLRLVDAVELDGARLLERVELCALALLAAAAAPEPAAAAWAFAAPLSCALLLLLPAVLLRLLGPEQLLGCLGELPGWPGRLHLQLRAVGPVGQAEAGKPLLPLGGGSSLSGQRRRSTQLLGSGSGLLGAGHLPDKLIEPVAELALRGGAILREFPLELIHALRLLPEVYDELCQCLVLDAPVVLDLNGDLRDQTEPA
mmetsp:Transcript_76646/g.228450  ORF Transcript_76646/g.228450 Transcript_76646/m.228450 type:complete len:359 (+) Transcript_76646:2459-3535(+)